MTLTERIALAFKGEDPLLEVKEKEAEKWELLLPTGEGYLRWAEAELPELEWRYLEVPLVGPYSADQHGGPITRSRLDSAFRDISWANEITRRMAQNFTNHFISRPLLNIDGGARLRSPFFTLGESE